MEWLNLPFRFRHTFATKYDGCQFFFGNNIFVKKVKEVWYRVDVIVALKYNYVVDYKMDNETICNISGRISSAVTMEWGTMDVEGYNSAVTVEDIEEY